MKRIVFAVTLILALTGCRAPARIRSALDVQARYTRVYVEATLPLLRGSQHPQREELEGIGIRLIRNSEALKNWANDAEKSHKDADNQQNRGESDINILLNRLKSRQNSNSCKLRNSCTNKRFSKSLFNKYSLSTPVILHHHSTQELGTWKGKRNRSFVPLELLPVTVSEEGTHGAIERTSERFLF